MASATVKKPGPPVPPRPQHTNTTASLLKAQRESFVHSINRSSPSRSPPTTPTTPIAPQPVNGRVTGGGRELPTHPAAAGGQNATQPPPVIGKKPALPPPEAGRTVIYKSPSMSSQTKPQIAAKTTPAPRPPLKARKAPDVPTAAKALGKKAGEDLAPAATVNLNRHHSMGAAKTAGTSLKDAAPRLSLGRADFEKVSHKIHLDQLQPALPLPKPRKIVQMPVATLDLDDDDDEEHTVSAGSSTFYTSTPVATTNGAAAVAASNSGGMKIFRRSKTTLDNLASRVSVTTIASNGSGSTGGGGGGGSSFLGGKTVELKNNLKNAAERLFSELIVSQQKQQQQQIENGHNGPLQITKHERAIQHQAVKELEIRRQQQQHQQKLHGDGKAVVMIGEGSATTGGETKSSAASSESLNLGTTRININSTSLSSEIENVLKSPEKKTAFHEILISELAAMRAKSSSMENLQTKEVTRIALNAPGQAEEPQSPAQPKAKPQTQPKPVPQPQPQPKPQSHPQPHTQPKTQSHPQPKPQSHPQPKPQSQPRALATANQRDANEIQKATNTTTITTTTTASEISSLTSKKFATRPRCNSLEDPDTEDADADNIDDVEGDDDDLRKSLKVVVSSAKGTPRKRTPSGCSSDSSPYGTERSARIRTSDWIEVGDNGKQVTLTSCHISLEDSGLEDEERMDDMSSSGVGDSWDSVKEAAQHEKRTRSNVKRVMSITELPPLPKSLSGFNKMLGSDSGLLSDADATMFESSTTINTRTNNNSDNVLSKLECQKEQMRNGENNNNNTGENGVTNNANTSATTTTTTLAVPESPDNISTSSSSEATTTTAIGANTPGGTLNAQLAFLKKEMYGLRQLDLSLLSQLWTLNDSIQEFRNMIQEQDEVGDDNDDEDDDDEDDEEDEDDDDEGEDEDDDDDDHVPEYSRRATDNGVVSYPRPSRSTSSYDPESSEGDDDLHNGNRSGGPTHSNGANNNTTTSSTRNLGAKPKIITTQPKLRHSNSIEYSLEATPPMARSAITLKPYVDMKPVPRMRSAPPPPPGQQQHRKAAAPPRPT